MSINPTLSKPVFWNAATLVGEVREVFAGLSDTRKPGNNRRYEMEDVALSAFAVFFTQSPSFLDYQMRMEELQGKSNATSLFGVHQIPSDNQIRQVLDSVPPEALFGLMTRIGDAIYDQGHLAPFRSVENTFLIALDGTSFFSSQVLYTNAWATSHRITQENLIKLVQAGRSRWKIENENNNTLKPRFSIRSL